MLPSAVLQHIQHIASLGLPDGVAIPEILDTIREAVPAAYGTFYWTDAVGNTRDLYAPPAVLEEMARQNVYFLYLNRHVGDPDCTAAERRFLTAAHPYIAHALGPQDVQMGGLDPEAEREGTITVTTEGEILSVAGDALSILADIPEIRCEWRLVGDVIHGHLPVALAPLIEALLAPMERCVAFLAGSRKSPGEIAHQLGITEHTLRSYLKSVYARTGAEGRAALAQAVRGD